MLDGLGGGGGRGEQGGSFSICVVAFFKPKRNSLVHLCTNLRNHFRYKLADQPHNWQYRWKTFVRKHVERKNWDLKNHWRFAVRGVPPQGIKIRIHLLGAGTNSFYTSIAWTLEASFKGECWEPVQPTSYPQVVTCKWLSEECLIWPIIPAVFVSPNVILLFDNRILFFYNLEVFSFFFHLCYSKLTL